MPYKENRYQDCEACNFIRDGEKCIRIRSDEGLVQDLKGCGELSDAARCKHCGKLLEDAPDVSGKSQSADWADVLTSLKKSSRCPSRPMRL